MEFIEMCADIEELISLCAKVGNAELCKELRELQELKNDKDYSTETSQSESECSDTDLVEEEYIINPSNNGFCELEDCNVKECNKS
jgi:hypothetical protein